MSILYERIAEQCDLQGITGYRLCKDCGISPSVITDLKNGRKKTLSADYVVRIAERLGVSTEYLLGKNENKPAHEEGELINGVSHRNEVMTEEETEIALLYRAASNDDKEVVKTVLRKYKSSSRPASFDVKAV